MKHILMILTSHRLDCFRLAIDALRATDSFRHFDCVVLLLNGVKGRHLSYVQRLIRDNPQVTWDTIAGPRGKGPLVANLQNECVRRYPDSLYFKIDEDVFVSDGWVEKLAAAYDVFRNDDDLALLTPVIPNNGAGWYSLLHRFPELKQEYARLFHHPVVPDCNGPVWIYPQIAEWITRRFLNLDQANQKVAAGNEHPYQRFAYRFSINCLVYDYRHWSQMGGIPDDEEPAWGQWVPDNGKFNILVTNTLVHHYSFFVQQDWLDRSTLLEDIRLHNVPDSPSRSSLLGYHLPRWHRIAGQLPRVLKRRLAGGKT